MHRLVRTAGVVVALSTVVGITATPSRASGQSGETVLPGTQCPAFPADNVWNTPITGLPVNSEQRHMARLDGRLDDVPAPGLRPVWHQERALRHPMADRFAVAAPRLDQVHLRLTERPRAVPTVQVDSDRERLRSARHHGEPVDLHALRALGYPLPFTEGIDSRDRGQSGACSPTPSARPAGRPPTLRDCRSSRDW